MPGAKNKHTPNPARGTWSITVDFTAEEAAALDSVRGRMSRTAFAKEATMRYAQIYGAVRGALEAQIEEAIRREPIPTS